jgi:isocitrate/isopropylmalate dehydrogenase
MPHTVTLIPGDGTGPEITEATRRVLEATGVQFDRRERKRWRSMAQFYQKKSLSRLSAQK